MSLLFTRRPQNPVPAEAPWLLLSPAARLWPPHKLLAPRHRCAGAADYTGAGAHQAAAPHSEDRAPPATTQNVFWYTLKTARGSTQQADKTVVHSLFGVLYVRRFKKALGHGWRTVPPRTPRLDRRAQSGEQAHAHKMHDGGRAKKPGRLRVGAVSTTRARARKILSFGKPGHSRQAGAPKARVHN